MGSCWMNEEVSEWKGGRGKGGWTGRGGQRWADGAGGIGDEAEVVRQMNRTVGG